MTTQHITTTLLSLSLGLAAIAGCDVDSANLDFERDLDELAEDSEGDLDEAPLDQDRLDELAIDVDDDATTSAPTNLALNKITWQSSTAYGNGPSKAVDGNRDGDLFNGSVTHTNLGAAGSWQVDLGSVEPVGEVVIYNRTDCCALLQDFDVRVSADGANWSSFRVYGVAGYETHVAIEREARYVKIENPNTLHMAEVEVFRSQNLALGKLTTQSDTYAGGVSSRTVDGNRDGNWFNNSVNHTDLGPAGWWQVDLGSVESVGKIVIYNRTDNNCGPKLHDFDVKVSADGVIWTTLHQPGVAGSDVHVDIERMARYVRIENPETLHMAEVEVFRSKNLALGKEATQSSTFAGGVPSLAVDGNRDGNGLNGTVSHTNLDTAGSWQVDLESVEPIGDIVIYNRTDCCALLGNFDVLVSTDGATWTKFHQPGIARDVTRVTIEREARYVKIENPTTLHMAEVEVFRS